MDTPTFYRKHEINKHRESVWTQMLEHLSSELDLGPLSDLSDKQKQDLEDDLGTYVDTWNEAESDNMGLSAKTEFAQLLAEYVELNERLLDVLDEENPYL